MIIKPLPVELISEHTMIMHSIPTLKQYPVITLRFIPEYVTSWYIEKNPRENKSGLLFVAHTKFSIIHNVMLPFYP